ncbi:hypothetical protein ACUY4Q_004487 [Phytobacter sp. AG2a]|jgi:hypothetical protein
MSLEKLTAYAPGANKSWGDTERSSILGAAIIYRHLFTPPICEVINCLRLKALQG